MTCKQEKETPFRIKHTHIDNNMDSSEYTQTHTQIPPTSLSTQQQLCTEDEVAQRQVRRSGINFTYSQKGHIYLLSL